MPCFLDVQDALHIVRDLVAGRTGWLVEIDDAILHENLGRSLSRKAAHRRICLCLALDQDLGAAFLKRESVHKLLEGLGELYKTIGRFLCGF
jgi:hypothetical protein